MPELFVCRCFHLPHVLVHLIVFLNHHFSLLLSISLLLRAGEGEGGGKQGWSAKKETTYTNGFLADFSMKNLNDQLSLSINA